VHSVLVETELYRLADIGMESEQRFGFQEIFAYSQVDDILWSSGLTT
jgi:hypothetical protein